MKDLCLKTLMTTLIPRVETENDRQIEKWGVQDHSPFIWIVIAAEEFGELNKAILENHFQPYKVTPRDVIKEAIQTATLCLKIAEMYGEEV